MLRELTLTNLLNQTIAEISEHARLVAIFVAIMIPLYFVIGWFSDGDGLSVGLGFEITENLLAQGFFEVGVVVACWLASVAATYWLYAALVGGTSSPGFGRLLPWIGVYILSSLGIVFGILLLIVPGIILMVKWIMVLPLTVKGDIPAMDTFGESSARTKGYGWSIFGAGFILILGMTIFAGILAGGLAMVGGANSIPGVAIVALSDTLWAALYIAFPVAAFRLSQDDTEEITDVFA